MRPMPPAELFESMLEARFIPAPELEQWARATFIDQNAELANVEHAHLEQASIGFLWTNEANERRGRLILGTCQLLPPSGDKWSVGRACAQLREWFGELPDFLIIIYGPAALEMDDASFMALVEHELAHAAQKKDGFGQPLFHRETGKPLWTVKPHDVEEHLTVVQRYGAWSPALRAMKEALDAGPTISAAAIEIACGTCLK